jgi:ABC-type polysaccharide/polyol phosphate export permease
VKLYESPWSGTHLPDVGHVSYKLQITRLRRTHRASSATSTTPRSGLQIIDDLTQRFEESGSWPGWFALAGRPEQLDAGLLLVALLVVGALPFTLLGLAVGALANTNTAAAILNALLLPSAFASGLFIPLEVLPAAVADLAIYNPVFHMAQVGLGVIEGVGVVDHTLALLGFTVVTATLAALAYRRSDV